MVQKTVDLGARMRERIFRAHMGSVLEALYQGEMALLETHPELLDAEVKVCYHGAQEFLPKEESWGKLRDAHPKWENWRADNGLAASIGVWLEGASIIKGVVAGPGRGDTNGLQPPAPAPQEAEATTRLRCASQTSDGHWYEVEYLASDEKPSVSPEHDHVRR